MPVPVPQNTSHAQGGEGGFPAGHTEAAHRAWPWSHRAGTHTIRSLRWHCWGQSRTRRITAQTHLAPLKQQIKTQELLNCFSGGIPEGTGIRPKEKGRKKMPALCHAMYQQARQQVCCMWLCDNSCNCRVGAEPMVMLLKGTR